MKPKHTTPAGGSTRTGAATAVAGAIVFAIARHFHLHLTPVEKVGISSAAAYAVNYVVTRLENSRGSGWLRTVEPTARPRPAEVSHAGAVTLSIDPDVKAAITKFADAYAETAKLPAAGRTRTPRTRT